MECSIFIDFGLIVLGGFLAGTTGYWANRLFFNHQRRVENAENRSKFKQEIKILLAEIKASKNSINIDIRHANAEKQRDFFDSEINTEIN